MLLRLIASCASNPPGYKLFAELLIEIESGAIPRTESVAQLEERIRACLDGRDPIEALELKRPRSRPTQSMREALIATERVVTEMVRILDTKPWPLPRGVLTQAISDVATKIHKDRRNVEKQWAKGGFSYEEQRAVSERVKFLKLHLSEEELSQLASSDARLAYIAAKLRSAPGGKVRSWNSVLKMAVEQFTARK